MYLMPSALRTGNSFTIERNKKSQLFNCYSQISHNIIRFLKTWFCKKCQVIKGLVSYIMIYYTTTGKFMNNSIFFSPLPLIFTIKEHTYYLYNSTKITGPREHTVTLSRTEAILNQEQASPVELTEQWKHC